MYITESLNSSHNIDNYLVKQATQDVKRKLSACFVIADNPIKRIKGYYTLSNSSISLESIPETIRERLPKSYINIPLTLIGRLAVDKIYQGQGIGKIMLVDALKRCHELSKQIGSFAVIVDPLDKDAELFYLKFGFIKLPDSGKMFLSMKTIDQLFK
ncbi:MAG: GNAT family N-acetyltransferase [Bacteroidetes bacterium GWF2_40_14]|nr:MAG: GNAT family N-acetyltransferase [Bacteroidetes bacterium GWF2_40_14]